ncbi:MAG: 3-dehydroquinate synthase [Spirochaetales bacterium]|nr:3-dehydroquinate synthase [Spirochaetia bacterium]MDD7014536.1 3-dehydroquinate synthase [Spirochaetales bacterium]
MAIIESNVFKLEFPANSGFSSSVIHFLQGKSDLVSLFYTEHKTLQKRLFVTDTNIASLESMKEFVTLFTKGLKVEADSVFTNKDDVLLVLGSGEKYKTIQNVLKIAGTALDANFNRNSLFVGIGGGVICDMTGFAASMFKRGIDVEFVPTTLLADVDASIGGKTGCDFDSYKNMIGAFYPASSIWIWSDFVQTLEEKEYRSGLAESLKTALLFNSEMWQLFKNNSREILNRESSFILQMITECAKAKAAIVNEDFKEKNRRAFLNLGHTFGHALESCAGLGKITHGEAVAWGIGRAVDLSVSLRIAEENFGKEVKDVLASYGYDMKPIPSCLENHIEVQKELLEAMHKDKKNQSDSIRVILQKNFSETFMQEVADEKILQVLK